jgi:hypothetical protein
VEHHVRITELSDSSNIGRAIRVAFALGVIAAASALLGACGNRADTAAPNEPSAIVITSPSGTIGVDGTIQFSATVTDANGNTIVVTPTWTVVDGGGTITSGGLFTAGDSAGVFLNTVVATTGTVSSSSTVTVTAGALATLTVTPDTVTLAVGATQHFTAVGKDTHGNVVAIPDRVWSVCGGGTIDTSGTFTAGVTPGSFPAAVHVMSGSLIANASVVITTGPLATITITPSPVTLAIGATQQFTAVGKDSHNNVVPITPVWSVVASGGTIDPGTGIFTAGTVAGTFAGTVKATSGSISSTAAVTVSPGVLETIVVTPLTQSLAIGATQQFTAVGYDADDNVVPISPTWTTLSGGTISSTGLFTAGTVSGPFVNAVRATVGSGCGGINGRASVTILPGALTTIAVSPTTVSLAEGATQQFTATGADSHGNAVIITPVWGIVGPGGGTINASTGLYTAGSVAGTYTNSVLATVGSLASLASVTVTAPVGALASIVITPANPSKVGSGTIQFTATGYDASMNVVAIPGTLSWSLNTAATVGTIDSEGLFSYNGIFNGTISNLIHVTNGTFSASTSVSLDCGC